MLTPWRQNSGKVLANFGYDEARGLASAGGHTEILDGVADTFADLLGTGREEDVHPPPGLLLQQ